MKFQRKSIDDTRDGNRMMLKNQAVEFKHHAKELSNAVKKAKHVDAWVVAKAERATTDLSDITHYLDGQTDTYARGGVTYIDARVKDNNYYRKYYTRYPNAIGSFQWGTKENSKSKYYNFAEGILYPLDEFDREYYAHLVYRLKKGEYLFRYRTDRMPKDEKRLIKINLDKALIYFMDSENMDEHDDKNIKFLTRGVEAHYIVVEYDKLFPALRYEHGGETNGELVISELSDVEAIDMANAIVSKEIGSGGGMEFTSGYAARRFLREFHSGKVDVDANEIVDYFSQPYELPAEVTTIIERYSDIEHNKDTLSDMRDELMAVGYEFDYDDDMIPYSLRRVGEEDDADDYASGGMMKDVKALEGQYILIHTMGVKEPIVSKIKKATIDDSKYRHRYVRIESLNGAEERIPLEDYDDFLTGKKVELHDGKETYMVQLSKPMAASGKTMASGGVMSKMSPNVLFYQWYMGWQKQNHGKIFIAMSLPNDISEPRHDYGDSDIILDVVEKLDDTTDAKQYIKEITNAADTYGVTIHLMPKPRVSKLKSESHRRKITKEYLEGYYQKFGFEKVSESHMMRKPKGNQSRTMAKGGQIDANEVEKSAKYYVDNPNWTVEKLEKEVSEYEDLLKNWEAGNIKPSKIIGGGYKSSAVARKLADKWVKTRVAVYKRAVELKKQMQIPSQMTNPTQINTPQVGDEVEGFKFTYGTNVIEVDKIGRRFKLQQFDYMFGQLRERGDVWVSFDDVTEDEDNSRIWHKKNMSKKNTNPKSDEIIIRGKIIKLKFIKRCCPSIKSDGSVGNYEYSFVDEQGEPYTGYGNTKEEALKSIEDYLNKAPGQNDTQEKDSINSEQAEYTQEKIREAIDALQILAEMGDEQAQEAIDALELLLTDADENEEEDEYVLTAYTDDMDSIIGRFTSVREAKKFAKENIRDYEEIVFEDTNGDTIRVSQRDTPEDIDFLFSDTLPASEIESKTSSERLKDIIRDRSNLASGSTSNVLYLSSEKGELFDIAGYDGLKPYSAQASDKKIEVTFNKGRTEYIFTNEVETVTENRLSYEKYGGSIYIFIPLTNRVAAEIISKYFSK